MDFRLFKAPGKEAAELRERGTCSLCVQKRSPVFALGIGDDLIVRCPACDAEVALDTHDQESSECTGCGAAVPFPKLRSPLCCCEACLKAGKAALTKSTELGMVRWEDARAGWTQGVPGDSVDGYETEPVQDNGDEEWVRVKISRDSLLQLVRTPGYLSIQEERWLFCCREPMVYLGSWSRERFNQEAADGDGRALFESLVEDAGPGLWEDDLHDETGIYVFECAGCKKRRAYWDIA